MKFHQPRQVSQEQGIRDEMVETQVQLSQTDKFGDRHWYFSQPIGTHAKLLQLLELTQGSGKVSNEVL